MAGPPGGGCSGRAGPPDVTALFETRRRPLRRHRDEPRAVGPGELSRRTGGRAAHQGRRAGRSRPAAWQLARLTVELTRPVPVGKPLTLTASRRAPRQEGVAGGRAAARRRRRGGPGTGAAHPPRRRRAARRCAPRRRHAAVDLRRPRRRRRPRGQPPPTRRSTPTPVCTASSRARWDVPGPVGVWIRLAVPVVDGEEPSGVQRVAAAADFGNGVSASLDHDQFLFINPDLTIHLLRPPTGEWVGMRTASRYATSRRRTRRVGAVRCRRAHRTQLPEPVRRSPLTGC